ncbi:hypothetical protein BACCAP_00783 [Pseudoflavonifractor capillosus ATCC 29799]|uniref:Uncharacterized protein n=1 Tax=Pseudoflavonifractor capillosus ATCC 29799 TaxID=411467 RepID=A6NRF4_9FIRM|nr:hypothetical protein BACCAP_00783 [Pseudoflavonifractor capillosus ATCC 29799]
MICVFTILTSFLVRLLASWRNKKSHHKVMTSKRKMPIVLWLAPIL